MVPKHLFPTVKRLVLEGREGYKVFDLCFDGLALEYICKRYHNAFLNKKGEK